MTFQQLGTALLAARRYASPKQVSNVWPDMNRLQAWNLLWRAVKQHLPGRANIEAPSTIVGNFREEFPEVKTSTK